MNESHADDTTRSRIIVIVPDRPGSLARVTEALAEAEVNIEMIDGRSAGELGVITLSTDDDDAALLALQRANLRALTSDTLVFRLPDKPGALAGVARLFGDHRINVRTIHIAHRLAGPGHRRGHYR